MQEKDILQEFVEEALQHLADVENDVLVLEKQKESVEPEIINHLFRSVHTVKGASGFLGLNNIGSLSHELENIFGLIRSKDISINELVTEKLLRGIDKLKELITQSDTSNSMDISFELDRLHEITNKSDNNFNKKKESEENQKRPFNYNEYNLEEYFKQGLSIIDCSVDLVSHQLEGKIFPKDLIEKLKSIGTIIDSSTDFQTIGEFKDNNKKRVETNKLIFSFLIATVIDDPLIITDGFSLSPIYLKVLKSSDIRENINIQKQEIKQEEPKKNVNFDHKAVDSTLKVPLIVLDKLMNLAGELVLVRNQNIQAVSSKDMQQITAIAQNLNVLTSEIQEAIMQTRMQPVGTVFNKFTRIIRDLANKLGKKIELQIFGSEVELDKSIIESIGDPLTHLIRNSVDHGIENHAVRIQSKKNETGLVILKAFHESGQVNIQIRDDGKGMDPVVLKKIAIEKGLLTTERADALSDKETFNLIFLPGFSTAEEVSDISGRGVGMDVVKSSFQKIGGVIDIASEIGKGTTITIKLPLTLAIVPSLIVSAEDLCFAIPQMNVVEIVWLYGADVYQKIKRIGTQEVYWLRGKLLKLVRLSKTLGIKKTYLDSETYQKKDDRREQVSDRRHLNDKDNDERRKGPLERRIQIDNNTYIAILKFGVEQFGLLIDKVIDTEEIVVKSLHEHLKSCMAYAGTAVMGDGRIALILDIPAIAELNHIGAKVGEEIYKTTKTEVLETQQILLFDIGGKEKFGLPLPVITRIESINYERVKISQGKEFFDYRGAPIPIIRPEKILISVEANYKNDFHTIIPSIKNPIGIACANILDAIIVESRSIDVKIVEDKCIAGSIFLNGSLILLLDIFTLIEKVEPNWFSQNIKKQNAKKQILLVEDSTFFGRLVQTYLSTSGFFVTMVCDGKAAMEYLSDTKPAIIISDLNMPVMDGFELARWVRKQNNLKDIPMIAISAIGDKDGSRLALDAGFDEFKSKHNREALLESLITLCAK